MLADGSRRDEQAPGALGSREPLRDQLQHVPRPFGQLRRAWPTLPPRTQPREVWTHEAQELEVAGAEVHTRAASEAEAAGMAGRRRQPELQLVLDAEGPHDHRIGRGPAKRPSRDEV